MSYSRRAVQTFSGTLATVSRPNLTQFTTEWAVYINTLIELTYQARDRNLIGEKADSDTFELSQIAQHSQAAFALDQLASRIENSDPFLQKLVREQQEIDEQIRELDKVISTSLISTKAPDKKNEVIDQISSLTKKFNALGQEIRGRNQKYKEVISSQAINADAVRGKLGHEEAAITYYLSPMLCVGHN